MSWKQGSRLAESARRNKMDDVTLETSVEETGSVEGAEGTEPEQPETDYRALYEKEKQERENLTSLIGRQGQELGDLRKIVQTIQKPGEIETKIEDYFDADTLKAIDKVVEQRVEAKLKVAKETAEQESLRQDFKAVSAEYDITEDNLTDLAYYAAAKGISLSQAAAKLEKTGVIEKRNGAAIPKRNANLEGAPLGMPKVPGGKPGASLDPARMKQDQYNALNPEQREALLRKMSGL